MVIEDASDRLCAGAVERCGGLIGEDHGGWL